MQWLNPLNFFCLIGPTLPYDVTDGSMAESPDGGVLLFGGRKSFAPDDMEDKILELRDINDSWNILNITLKSKRYWHTLISLQ